jgi:hypothetical protein
VSNEHERQLVAQEGDAWIRDHLEPDFVAEHRGKLLILELKSGHFQISDEEHLTRDVEHYAREFPDSMIYLARIGSDAAFELGHGTLDEAI